MCLKINDKRYAVARRIKQGDTVKFLSVSPTVEDISGSIKLFRDDGFLISEDVAEDYARRFMAGSLLTLTNQPEPTPATTPSAVEQLRADVDYIAVMTGVEL